MRFHLGGIPETEDFIPDDSWNSLKEPKPWLFQLYAVPVALINLVILKWCWSQSTSLDKMGEFSVNIILIIAGIIIVHELLHALVHPKFGRSNKSVIGLWPSKIVFYAHYEGELSRNRIITIYFMPLMIISVLPLILSFVVPLNSTIAIISIINGLLACGDVLAAGMVLCQVPANGTVRNKGWLTYWRQ